MFQTRKTVCPVSREQFEADSKPLEVAVNGVPLVADVKQFSTGSFGWYHSGKVTIRVGDTVVTVQCGLTFTVVGSKELPMPATQTEERLEAMAIRKAS